MSKIRIAWIDYAKGLGIILVVYGHVVGGAYTGNIEISNAFIVSHNIIYHFHMPLFFFLAGLFVHQSIINRGTKSYVVKKLHVLLYPYFVWSILEGMTELFMSRHTYINTTLLDLLSIPYQPIKHFWFLYALFLMYMAYAISLKTKGLSLHLFILLSLLLYFYPIKLSVLTIDHFCINLVFFTIGIVYRQYLLDAVTDRFVSLWAILLFMVIFAGFESSMKYIYMGPIVLFFTSVVGIIMVMLISKYFAAKELFPLLKTIGMYSMPIYLVHGFGGSGTRIILHDFIGLNNQAFLIGLSTVVGVATSILIYWLSYRINVPYLFQLHKDQ